MTDLRVKGKEHTGEQLSSATEASDRLQTQTIAEMTAAHELKLAEAQSLAASSTTPPADAEPAGTVKLVVQRVDAASLLIDNQDGWVSIGKGLLLYVSFAQGCDGHAVRRAAKSLLALPLCTMSGVWGDGSPPGTKILVF